MIDAGALRRIIAEELPRLIDLRHDLHAHPELGYDEHRTSEVIHRELADIDIDFKPGLAGGTGVVAHLPGQSTQAIGLRADIDALPIEEVTGLPYASTIPGRMHACGHDGHTTMLIGAGRVLSRIARESALPRAVTLVFQPAEEGGAGGKRMVEDGCLDGSVIGTPIEEMFGLHGWPHMTLGQVGTRPGAMLAAADMFEIDIEGVGAHAAWPHGSRDPIVAAAALVQAAQSIVSRNVGPLESAVVSITQIHSGTTHNIIPGRATLTGTVRTLDAEVQQRIMDRLDVLSRGVAEAHGCRATLTYHVGYPTTINDARLVDEFNTTAVTALGPDRLCPLAEPVMGGEDFSFYGQKVPACFFALGLRPADARTYPDLHQPTFDFNDEAIPTGIEMFCRLAMRERSSAARV